MRSDSRFMASLSLPSVCDTALRDRPTLLASSSMEITFTYTASPFCTTSLASSTLPAADS